MGLGSDTWRDSVRVFSDAFFANFSNSSLYATKYRKRNYAANFWFPIGLTYHIRLSISLYWRFYKDMLHHEPDFLSQIFQLMDIAREKFPEFLLAEWRFVLSEVSFISRWTGWRITPYSTACSLHCWKTVLWNIGNSEILENGRFQRLFEVKDFDSKWTVFDETWLWITRSLTQ